MPQAIQHPLDTMPCEFCDGADLATISLEGNSPFASKSDDDEPGVGICEPCARILVRDLVKLLAIKL